MNGQTSLMKIIAFMAGIFSVLTASGQSNSTVITIDADQVLHTNSSYLTGACIEDVNHEIYGGLDSQMIFGESFAEPAAQLPLKDFKMYDGHWTLTGDGGIQGDGSDGAKIIWNGSVIFNVEASVEVKLAETNGGNGGLILKVQDAGNGPDAFTGYEISLERPGFLVLGRHRGNWEPIRRVPCNVPANEWIKLTVRMNGNSLEVFVDGKSITRYEDEEHPLTAGGVGLRIWQSKVLFRNLSVKSDGTEQKIPFAYDIKNDLAGDVSGMWQLIQRGEVKGNFSLVPQDAFSGNQSQQITFASGSGEIGIENRSLNHWGMNFSGGKKYDGYLWVQAGSPTELFVSLENRDGSNVYAEKALNLKAGGWQRLDFQLTPKASDNAGQFAIKLKQPGTVTIGYVFLQPGAWGRYKNLPVRKDVAEALINQGITVMRYGGSMVNNSGYRWKKMIGPRAQRPPYAGHWYPFSSNGWGIFDFLNFSEAAGFLGIPDLDINESPRDIADLMDYLNGTSDTEWGKKRAADGHPAPYRLKYLELGNEERVDADYFKKFKTLAEVIWAKDPAIILIVGDFSYHKLITDPFDFSGADSGITTMAAQQKILQLTKQHDREVWFDLHVWTEDPQLDGSLPGMFSYLDALDKIADGAKHKVLVFELNANNHAQRRALANALAINAIQRDGRLPIACSANCLQPDGQNDNQWDQGLLFMNPSQVWLQPPGYVTKMYAENYQPVEVRSHISGPDNGLDVSSELSRDGKTLVFKVVNLGEKVVPASIQIRGYLPSHTTADVEELSGSLGEVNTAAEPHQIQPVQRKWQFVFNHHETEYNFQPYSITVLKFKR